VAKDHKSKPLTVILNSDTVDVLWACLCGVTVSLYAEDRWQNGTELFTSSHPPIPNIFFQTSSTYYFHTACHAPSGPHNAPWFSSATLALCKSLTYLAYLNFENS